MSVVDRSATTVPSPPRPAPRPPVPAAALARSWAPDVVGTVAWLSLLAVVCLWLADGQVQALSAWGSGLTSLGRLTGLVSADLLLLQVLLMARLPFVEQAYGQDELARRHRLVGFTSFTLMLAHLVLIWFGYALEDGRNPFAELWDLVVDYPGMLLATAGTACLVMVVVTSVKRARRRLRYESWHFIHLYAYLGVGLALPHQLWTGQEFQAHAGATFFWWSAWALTAASVLVWRVGVPVYRTLRHDLRVVGVVRETPDTVSVWMSGRHLDRLPVRAGQFFTWRFLDGAGWTRGHPYSLSAVPMGRLLRITVKDLGDGSHSLAGVAVGTRVAIEGPFGRLHAGVRSRRKVTLLAGGIGVTPLRALVEELPQEPGDVTVVYRARDEGDVLFREEFDRLVAARGARVVYAVGPRVAGRRSWLPQEAAGFSDRDGLLHLVPDIAGHDVYICGSPDWMDAARDAALAAGVPATRIHTERFAW